jgi:hypothetical protein
MGSLTFGQKGLQESENHTILKDLFVNPIQNNHRNEKSTSLISFDNRNCFVVQQGGNAR